MPLMKQLRKIPFLTIFPILCLIGLCIVMLVTVFVQAKTYGITVDEPLQNSYGHTLLAWYTSHGKDTSFLRMYPDAYMPQHGAVFETFVAFVQRLVGHEWYTRAVITALAGVSGVIAIALCGFELAGWWGALLAALALWLYPRYFGAIFNNSKDIPFAAAMTWLLWSTLLLIKHWGNGKKSIWNSILVGFFIGLAASIRVTAVIWFAVLVLLAAGWWLFYGARTWKEKKLFLTFGRQASRSIVIGLVSLITMMLCWPYIFLNPFYNLYDSIRVMGTYPWTGSILYNGQVYLAAHLPRSYVPTWLVVGSPPVLIVFVLIGISAISLIIVRKKCIEARIAVVLLAFLVPCCSLIALRSVLYDGLRQFIFIIPPMILIAVYGMTQLYRYLITHRQKLIAIAMVVLTLVSYILVIARMIDLHPYEYTYFNPIVGPQAVAVQKYQLDYWGTCEKEAGQWLAQNYKRYTNKPNPTMTTIAYWDFLWQPYLPANFQPDAQNPDFYIVYNQADHFSKYPTYKVIYTVSREDTPYCIIKVNPASKK
jgi:4-amino-4-deoxy-L-arabinose transferase-like glycosyltransferase